MKIYYVPVVQCPSTVLYRILTETHEGVSERIVIHVDIFIIVVLSFCCGDGLCVCDNNYNFPNNGLKANFTKNV
jgi:hypothetical protein